eukprot:6209422-Pleurochrysis_carterae.AAC.2
MDAGQRRRIADAIRLETAKSIHPACVEASQRSCSPHAKERLGHSQHSSRSRGGSTSTTMCASHARSDEATRSDDATLHGHGGESNSISKCRSATMKRRAGLEPQGTKTGQSFKREQRKRTSTGRVERKSCWLRGSYFQRMQLRVG